MEHSILIVTSEFPPLPGGIGNHAYLLSKYLHYSGYTIKVLCDYRSEKDDKVFDQNQSFPIVRIRRNSLTYVTRLGKAFQLIQQQEIVLASGKFSLWTVALLSIIFKKKYLAILHGSELKAGNRMLRVMTRWSLKRFDTLIAVSNFTKAITLQLNPLLKVEVINNGIECEQETEQLLVKDDKEAINLVTVGNLTLRKGQQNMIRALPLLKQHFPRIHYHCIGIPTNRNEFQQLVDELKVTECVTFHGVLPDNEKKAVLRNATAFVMLSDVIKNDVEGFGIAILEANLLGLPAIGSKNSGIADAIKDGFSGKLVDPHNPAAIQDALAEIMHSYQAYSNRAKAWAVQFDWKIKIKEYLNILEDEA